MARIEPEFEKLRATGVAVRTWNADALDAATREGILDELVGALGEGGRVRLLLHSIAFGNLKPLALVPPRRGGALRALASELGLDESALAPKIAALYAQGFDEFLTLAPEVGRAPGAALDEDDVARTVHAMGTSLLGWTQSLLLRGLFHGDARVLGLTSEGNAVAWSGYAAVSTAKAALEALSRSLAVELAPFGVRCNVVQPGVTDTPALRMIPGSDRLRAHARLRNPFRRLTTPEDVADAICLLCTDEARWINGEVIRVDGGEHVAGAAW